MEYLIGLCFLLVSYHQLSMESPGFNQKEYTVKFEKYSCTENSDL